MLRRLWRRSTRSIATRGWRGSARALWFAGVRNVAALRPGVWREQLRERAFDARYGVDTRGHWRLYELDVSPTDAAHGHRYQAISQARFERAMQALARDPADRTFVDLGSGKGKAVMLAALYGFRRALGVELSGKLHAVATRNFEAFARRAGTSCTPTSHHRSADRFEFPNDALVVFLYNPFDAHVLGHVLERLVESFDAAPRPISLVYVHPKHRDVLDRHERLRTSASCEGVVVYEVLAARTGTE